VTLHNPTGAARVSSSLRRNIEALDERRRAEAAISTTQEYIADVITKFAGSMWFVYLHLALYTAWILTNLGWVPGIPQFDPSFVILAMEASVEAIFLSTFVLISQNRGTEAEDKRANLDLHISLLTEHELTKLTQLVMAIAARLDVNIEVDEELQEITKDVAPEAVLDELESKLNSA
jgi:uncharacterized membrane protein